MLFLNLNHDLSDTPYTKNPEYYNTSGLVQYRNTTGIFHS